eukprot:jgi/Hompol1/413/HPOL_003645-RA
MAIRLGLERIKQLLDVLHQPHDSFKSIHVSGTNGKGSICMYVASVLQAAEVGLVGTFTSPHLVEPRDSVRIQGRAVSAGDFQAAAQQVQHEDSAHSIGASPFEQLVATAFVVFRQQQVKYAVIEVGLGGTEDATNVLNASQVLVAVVGPVGLDHADILGRTPAAIAAHKAGIVKPGISDAVVALQPDPDALATITAHIATIHGCRLHLVRAAASRSSNDRLVRVEFQGQSIDIPQMLPGDFQLENIATAMQTLCVLASEHGVPITGKALVAGFGSVRWPGRLEWLQGAAGIAEGRRVLLDGAHNPMAAAVLAQYVNTQRRIGSGSLDGRVNWIVGFTRGKDIQGILRLLVQPHDRVYAVPFTQPQGMAWIHSEDTATICEAVKCLAVDLGNSDSNGDDSSRGRSAECIRCDDFLAALNASGQRNSDGSHESDMTVICGSLYLVADVYRQLHLEY